MTTLVITNDFPPRAGGIQSFVHTYVQQLTDPIVYAPRYEGDQEFDRGEPYPVFRHPGSLMTPTPRVRRRALALIRHHEVDSVWFGAAAPLGLLAGDCRRAGVRRVVVTTHGHEVGWARLPVARSLMSRIARQADAVTFLGEYTRSRLAPIAGTTPLIQLPGGVDCTIFHPGAGGDQIRAEYNLGEAPLIVCVSRLVERKGQDTLIRALPAIRRAIPAARLLIVGTGPYEQTLRALAARSSEREAITFTGEVPGSQLPAFYDAATVFAMPCRTLRHGLDVEGLGIVYLEASATGKPVLAGRSGGAPDAVLDGETGLVVDGNTEQVAAALTRLLRDPERCQRMGRAGRRWTETRWRTDLLGQRLATLLDPDRPVGSVSTWI